MNTLDQCVVLIPAYQPDEKLINLLIELRPVFKRIVLVDDGSTKSDAIFAKAKDFSDAILKHEVNRGKGAAIKTGLVYILEAYPDAAGVITADADGQHIVRDIVRVAERMIENPNGLTLGVRRFTGKVPLRSIFGNKFTIFVFFLLTGMKVSDTQTGLRGIPHKLIRRASKLPGKRYEYEMTMLADAKRHDALPVEVPIDTIYIQDNASSHFHPIKDAIRIYRSLLQFCISSVAAFLLDNIVFSVLIALLNKGATGREMHILIAFAVARFISGNFQYLYNRFVVFKQKVRKRSYFQYWLLAIGIALLSAVFTGLLSRIGDVRGFWITLVKILVETGLFFGSYSIQKKWVFKRRK